MVVVIASDHGGVRLKRSLAATLEALGHVVNDLGADGSESVDYPDYARAVAEQVVAGSADRGILVCGTGIGMSIAANKVRGVRAAVVSDTFSARMAMEHNDARVLCLGERTLGASLADECVKAWLATEFGGGRHLRRVSKISAIEDGVSS